MSRGRNAKASKVVKPKKAHTKTTPRHQNHRFETFSQRIAKLKIDPIRRTKRIAELEPQDGSSCLRAALEQWKDVNMSAIFTAFVQEVDPLCQSLPQVVHHQDQILEVLLRHVEKHDAYSLEPLLDLVAQLAHDLGARFEKSFEGTVKVVAQLAAVHTDAAVIEWSFNCLAWLFKFLSRLLVPNLCPLYDLLAPLLGKTRQKAFVSSFAADAVSFLIRKAAAIYQKDSQPLTRITRHILHDVGTASGPADGQYQQAVAAIFGEAMKGIQRGVSSGAQVIYGALIGAIVESQYDHAVDTSVLMSILRAITVFVIHNSDAEGFRPIQDAISNFVTSVRGHPISPNVYLTIQVLFNIVGTRKGSRVSDWHLVLDCICMILDATSSLGQDDDTSCLTSAIEVVAAVIQYAPIDALSPHLHRLLETVTQGCFKTGFLRLCILVADTGVDRFQSLMLRDFERYRVHVFSPHSWFTNVLTDLLLHTGLCMKSRYYCCYLALRNRMFKSS